jgi:hypothetical protein
MNGIDEFIELSVGLFAVITGLIVLLTYMERTLPKADDAAQPVNDRRGATAAIHRWWRRRWRKS